MPVITVLGLQAAKSVWTAVTHSQHDCRQDFPPHCYNTEIWGHVKNSMVY